MHSWAIRRRRLTGPQGLACGRCAECLVNEAITTPERSNAQTPKVSVQRMPMHRRTPAVKRPTRAAGTGRGERAKSSASCAWEHCRDPAAASACTHTDSAQPNSAQGCTGSGEGPGACRSGDRQEVGHRCQRDPPAAMICPGEGSNLHPITGTWPSTMRVCQFRHPGWG